MSPSYLKCALFGALASLAILREVTAHGQVSWVTVDENLYNGYDPTQPTTHLPSPIVASDNTNNGPKTFDSGGLAEELGMNGPDTAVAALHAAANAGSVVTWFWQEWPSGHIGPVTTFMSRCPDSGCSGYNGNAADNWFKAGEYGLDSSGKWGSDYIASTNSLAWQFTIPDDIPQGYYLLRHEIIAMHQTNDPQFYPITMYIALTSSGAATPSPLGSFPAMYDNTTTQDDAMTWNIYQANVNTGSFVVPGVALYDPAAAGSSKGAPDGTTIPTGTAITADATVASSGGSTAGSGSSSSSVADVAGGSASASASSGSSVAAAASSSAAVAPSVSSSAAAVVASASSSVAAVVSTPSVAASVSPSTQALAGSATSAVLASDVNSSSSTSISPVSSVSSTSPTAAPSAAGSAKACTRKTTYVTVTA